jgi:hypothetical protein
VAGEDVRRGVGEDIGRVEDLVLQTRLDDTGKPRLALIGHP